MFKNLRIRFKSLKDLCFTKISKWKLIGDLMQLETVVVEILVKLLVVIC